MHADPVIDAARHFDPRYAHAEEQAHAEALAATCFIDALRSGDASAPAFFAKRVPDTHGINSPTPLSRVKTSRYQTLAEVVMQSLDYSNGPSVAELVQLALNVANGSLAGDVLQAQAKELLRSAAITWAANNVTLEAD